MRKLQSKPINITSNGKCLTVLEQETREDPRIVSSACVGNRNQVFFYDPVTTEIRNNGGCVEVDSSSTVNGVPIRLAPCNGGINQMWNFNMNDTITTELDNSKCMDVTGGLNVNGTPLQIWDCWGGNNQKFTTKPAKMELSTPKIMRNNMVIPPGTLPIPQLATLPPHSVLLINPDGKSILVNANIILDQNSRQLECLGSVSTFVMGPLSNLTITYLDENALMKNLYFVNETPEHDLIYNYATSFSNSNLVMINSILSYQIIIKNYPNIKTTMVIDAGMDSGEILISKNDVNINLAAVDLNNFSSPSNSMSIEKTIPRSYILGPYTMAIVGELYLYNSGDKPLLYHDLSGINAHKSDIITYMASPLNSGYATFTMECNFTGTTTTALVGEYATSFAFEGTASPRNPDWTRDVYYSNGLSESPVERIGDNQISGVIVGPYTKVTLCRNIQDNSCDPRNRKIFENNSAEEVRYDLCVEGFNDMTNMIKIEFSDSYVGFGLISTKNYDFNVMTVDQACPLEVPSPPLFIQDPLDAENIMVDNVYTMKIPLSLDGGENLIDCGNSGISGFKIIQERGQYFIKYACNDNTNYNRISTGIMGRAPIDMTNGLTNINIDCDSRAIMAVKATVENGNIIYEYICGDRNLGNVIDKFSDGRAGNRTDFNLLANQKVYCGLDRVLSAASLAANSITPDTNLYNFYYSYECGIPIESFQLDDNKKVVNICYKDKDNNQYYIATAPMKNRSYRKIRPASRTIRIDGTSNMAVILKKKSGGIDKIMCKGFPVDIENKNYTGFMVLCKNDLKESFGTQNGNLIDWYHIVGLIIVIIIVYVIYKKLK